MAQSHGWGNPSYQIVDESGPDHKKRFIVRVNVNNRWLAKGIGSSKKKAEQIAARNALQKLKGESNASAQKLNANHLRRPAKAMRNENYASPVSHKKKNPVNNEAAH